MDVLGKNENPVIWKNNVIKALIDLSDNDFQHETWLGKNQNFISSYTETINTLFDSYDFERYTRYYKSIKGENKLSSLFNELILMVENYNEPEKEEEILQDSKWISITNKAKEIISNWYKF